MLQQSGVLGAVDLRDSTDLPVLAIHGHAEVLVAGDKDLLVLDRVEALPILDPRGFWNLA
jgi:predicted nucleic acid-binding protein